MNIEECVSLSTSEITVAKNKKVTTRSKTDSLDNKGN